MGAPKVTSLPGMENTLLEQKEERIRELESLIEKYEKISPAQQREHISLLTEENKRLIAEKVKYETLYGQVVKTAKAEVESVKHQLKLAENSKNTAWGNVKDRNSKLSEVNSTVEKKEEAIKQKDSTINKQVDIIEKKDLKIEGLEQAIENIKETLRVVTESKIILESQVDSYKEQIEKQDRALELLADILDRVDSLNVGSGSIAGLSEEQTKSLIEMLLKNKNYIVNSTVGKGVVRDSSKAKDKVEMVIEYINNGESATEEMATKYGYSNTSGVINYAKRLKDSWYVVIKDYIDNGNSVTDSMESTYENEYADILNILKNR